jgi:very-short-patch-repair endonuclease
MKNKKQHDPNPSGVVFLQRVADYKLDQAQALRKNMTPEERIFWERVRRNQVLGLPFRRQQPIAGFVVDFYCNTARCVVEIDGGIHDEPERKKEDVKRRKVFENRGLIEIRYTNQEVREDIDGVIERLKKALALIIASKGRKEANEEGVDR